MPAPFALRLSRDGFDREARSDDLRRLAARYARDELAGRILAHHRRSLPSGWRPRRLRRRRGLARRALLWAIPELPSLLSHALYVPTSPTHRMVPASIDTTSRVSWRSMAMSIFR